MSKIDAKISSSLFPIGVFLVSCGEIGKNANIVTMAWVIPISSNPPLLGISLRKKRHSYELIKKSNDFVVNIPTREILKETDYCGNVSGRDVNKFEKTVLTPIPGKIVNSPIIKECPINLECKVIKDMELGDHNLIVGEVVSKSVNEEILNEREKPDINKINLFSYGLNKYFAVRGVIGKWGFSFKHYQKS
jgi:flavin reductase (DIM6/NTAB) family NADH-FMN oxidoreductase RutF